MVRKTKEEAQATRSAILDAAEIIFQERGVSRTSLAEIAAMAGVTRGAIYWHFANKLDLFDALIQRLVCVMDAKLDELRTQRHYDDPVDMMRELTFYFLDRMVNDPNYSRVIEICWFKCEYVGEMMAIREKHFKRHRDICRITATAFQASQERGFLLPHVDPDTAAFGLMGVMDGLMLNWMLDRSAFSLLDTGMKIFDTYMSSLRAEGHNPA